MLQRSPSPWSLAGEVLDKAVQVWKDVANDWNKVDRAEQGFEDAEEGADVSVGEGQSQKAVQDTTGSVDSSNPDDTGNAATVMEELDENRVRKAGQMILSACSTAKGAIEKRRVAVDRWKMLRSKIRAYAWNLMLQRGQGKPLQLLDRKEVRERLAFTRIRVGGEGNVIDAFVNERISMEENPDDELHSLHAFLDVCYHDTKRIYRHYASSEPGAAGTMDEPEFLNFVRDSKLISSHLTVRQAQHIFGEVARNMGTGDAELQAADFIIALVHLAVSLIRHAPHSHHHCSLSSLHNRTKLKLNTNLFLA
tara:strand:- start:789 stop:1712 length:924 start_codon:yes stop_codon:yes gene_type:complete